MLIVEDAAHPRPLLNPQHIGGGEAQIVILQYQPGADMIRALLPSLDPAGAARLAIVIDATDMGDDHRLRVQPHPVEHLRLAGEIANAPRRQPGIGRVEQDILRGVEGQADVERAGLGAERPQFRIALRDHVMELRHVGMGGVGRDVRGQAVHIEPLRREIVEHRVEQFERAFQMRVLLPAPRILRLQLGAAHHLDRKAEAQGAVGIGHRGSGAGDRIGRNAAMRMRVRSGSRLCPNPPCTPPHRPWR